MIARTIALEKLFGEEHAPDTDAQRAMAADNDLIPDPRVRIDAERREFMEGVTLRLLWAVAGGGDEGACAAAAIAVIRFAEAEGHRWTDRALRALHHRSFAAKLGLKPFQTWTFKRYNAARDSLARTLFLPTTRKEEKTHEKTISYA